MVAGGFYEPGWHAIYKCSTHARPAARATLGDDFGPSKEEDDIGRIWWQLERTTSTGKASHGTLTEAQREHFARARDEEG